MSLSDTFYYQHRLSRRDSLKLFAALAGSSLLPALTGCEPAATKQPAAATAPGLVPVNSLVPPPWPQLALPALSGAGYGKDPNLLIKAAAPWPLTLTAIQLASLALLADLILPRQGEWPAASELAVPTVLDEWVSAPYPNQQQDRLTLLSLLSWLDAAAQQQGLSQFTDSRPVAGQASSDPAEPIQPAAAQSARYAAQRMVLDAIAGPTVAAGYEQAAQAFDRLRQLVVAAYYCHETGSKLLGYQGNTAIAGDYPGPTAAAYQHLNEQLVRLGLTAVS